MHANDLAPRVAEFTRHLSDAGLGDEDAIISDALNHASIIDGIRLSKARRYRYANNDIRELEERLKEAADARFRLIATDGVFSMDGVIANLKGICDLAEEYDAMVMVDDSHAVGFVGEQGRGTPEYCGVQGRVHILTGTLGKALGGGLGWLHGGEQAGGRMAAPAFAALSLFQHADARDRRGLAEGVGHDRAGRRLAPPALRQRRALPRQHGKVGFQARRRRPPNHSGDDWRCRARFADGRHAA
jgi:selenocysteine lyase/cysteine desulfurase